MRTLLALAVAVGLGAVLAFVAVYALLAWVA